MQPFVAFFPSIGERFVFLFDFYFFFLTNILRTVPFLHPLPAQVFFSSPCFTSVCENTKLGREDVIKSKALQQVWLIFCG